MIEYLKRGKPQEARAEIDTQVRATVEAIIADVAQSEHWRSFLDEISLVIETYEVNCFLCR